MLDVTLLIDDMSDNENEKIVVPLTQALDAALEEKARLDERVSELEIKLDTIAEHVGLEEELGK